MNDKPIRVCKGEVFDRVTIYKDRIECTNDVETVVLTKGETGCLDFFNNRICTNPECRHYINDSEIDNCSLCSYQDSSLSNIARCLNVSREMIRQDEERALCKARKQLRRINKNNKSFALSDFLADPPISIRIKEIFKDNKGINRGFRWKRRHITIPK